jgi:GNAT superfamily N-acetyltransferase
MSLERNELYTIRDYMPEDKNFILATWLRGLRYGNPWFNSIDSKAYFDSYHALLTALITKPGISVKIACLRDDAEVILGYAVYQGTRADWLFVKKAWRGIGIAKSLMPNNITVVSHITDVGRGILRKYPHIIFNPFSIT